MEKPVIGLTCHTLPGPTALSNLGPMPRSGVAQQYIDAVAAAGGAPVLIPLGLDAQALSRVYGLLDGLLLPGGDDVSPERYGHARHPKLGAVDDARDELEITLASWALRDDLPVLGICRGIQVLAVAAGGTLYQDLPSELEEAAPHDVRDFGRDHLAHTIAVSPGSLLSAAIGSECGVNSFHHQSIRDLPPTFTVSARAPDGVVEGIESPDRRFALGVQCHPEGMWRTTGGCFAGLFRAFVEAAGSPVAASGIG